MMFRSFQFFELPKKTTTSSPEVFLKDSTNKMVDQLEGTKVPRWERAYRSPENNSIAQYRRWKQLAIRK